MTTLSSDEMPMKSPYHLIAEREDIKRALSGIVGFVWDSTPQGHDYWKNVYSNLLALEAQAQMIEADAQPCLPEL